MIGRCSALWLGAWLAASQTLPAAAQSDGRQWVPTQTVVAADATARLLFGSSIAARAELAFIGAPRDPFEVGPAPGVVYMLAKDQGAWSERQKLSAPEPMPGDVFGSALVWLDDLLIAYAETTANTPEMETTRQLHVFARVADRWLPKQTIAQRELELSPVMAGERGVLAVGSPSRYVGDTPQQGVVLIFERSGEQLELTETLRASQTGQYSNFGAAVALSGDTLAVAAPAWGLSEYPEAVYVFTRSSQGWVERQRLTNPDAASSQRHDFGKALALHADTLVVGASDESAAREDARGAAYVFAREGELWRHQQTLRAPEGKPGEGFGCHVYVDSALIAVSNGSPNGAQFLDAVSGKVSLYTRMGAQWKLHSELAAPETKLTDQFGGAIARAGEALLIGAIGVAADAKERSGAVYVEELRAITGNRCAGAGECASGSCIGGVCCERDCGACGSCEDGRCTARPAGAPGEPSCAPYVCGGDSDRCPDSCTTQLACDRASYCAHGACVAKGPASSACTDGVECASGHCVEARCVDSAKRGEPCSRDEQCDTGHCSDGVCCDEACHGACEACAEPGSPGMCRGVEGSPRGTRERCGGDAEPCRGRCELRERSVCTYASNDLVCSSACDQGVLTPSACDGAGACVVLESHSCAGDLACADAHLCKQMCESNSDCAADYVCQPDGACTPLAVCVSEQLSRGAGERTQDCWPYRCNVETGSCRTSCGSVHDCVAPQRCDARGQCRMPRAASESGGGCALTPLAARAWPTLWGLVLFGLWRSRRRLRR